LLHKNNYMNPIKIDAIREALGMTRQELAAYLYPDNKSPYQSLKRVIDGETTLGEKQIVMLSAITGLSFDSLFNFRQGWKLEHKDGLMIFLKGPYTVKLNPSTWEAYIYKTGELSKTDFIIPKTLTVKEFINTFNTFITKQEI